MKQSRPTTNSENKAKKKQATPVEFSMTSLNRHKRSNHNRTASSGVESCSVGMLHQDQRQCKTKG